MDTPDPHRMTRRKKFDAFEQGITGGHHIGHLPVYVHEIEGWTFRRCRCGFSLALTPSGAIWWLRTTNEAVEINGFKSLLRALRSNCWAHPRPKPLTMRLLLHPQLPKSRQNPPILPLQTPQSLPHLDQRHWRCKASSKRRATTYRRRCRGWKNRHPPSSGGPTFPTTPRAQCAGGKTHLVDDNLLKTRSKGIAVRRLPLAIYPVRDRDWNRRCEAPVARLGARRHESGPRHTGVHAGIRRGRPGGLRRSRSYDNSPRKRCGPGFRRPRWRCYRHALPYHTGLIDILPRPRDWPVAMHSYFFSPVSREAAFLLARIAGGAVVVLNGWPKAVPCGVSRVWVGLSRLGAEPLLRRGFGLSS